MPITEDLIVDAWAVGDRFAISYWDALIVVAARRAGCDRLLSEDLQDGHDFGGLVVTNPFVHPPDET